MATVVKEIYMAYQALIKPSLQFHLALDENLSLPVNIDRMRFIQVISNFWAMRISLPEWFYYIRMQSG